MRAAPPNAPKNNVFALATLPRAGKERFEPHDLARKKRTIGKTDGGASRFRGRPRRAFRSRIGKGRPENQQNLFLRPIASPSLRNRNPLPANPVAGGQSLLGATRAVRPPRRASARRKKRPATGRRKDSPAKAPPLPARQGEDAERQAAAGRQETPARTGRTRGLSRSPPPLPLPEGGLAPVRRTIMMPGEVEFIKPDQPP